MTAYRTLYYQLVSALHVLCKYKGVHKLAISLQICKNRLEELKMPRPRVDEEAVKYTKNLAIRYQTKPVTWIHEKVQRAFKGKAPGPRKTYDFVREAREEAALRAKVIPNDPPIEPWGEEWPSDADEAAYLLMLWGASRLIRSKLSIRHAKWARRLRVALQPCFNVDDAWRNLATIGAYVRREQAHEFLGGPELYTLDLNWYVMLKPWLSEEAAAGYKAAIADELVPGVDIELDLMFWDETNPGVIERMRERILKSEPLREVLNAQPVPGATMPGSDFVVKQYDAWLGKESVVENGEEAEAPSPVASE